MTVFDKVDWIYEPASVSFIALSVSVSFYALGLSDEFFATQEWYFLPLSVKKKKYVLKDLRSVVRVSCMKRSALWVAYNRSVDSRLQQMAFSLQ